MMAKKFFVEVVYRFAASLERAQGSQRLYVLLVYFSILLDNLLLTAVVPVIPDFLVGINLHDQQDELVDSSPENHHDLFLNDTLVRMVEDYRLGINGKSMAFLHHMNPNLNTENGQVGAILSSKAFVQLAFNPLVSLIINRLGYELTLILGVAVLLQSCVLYLIGQSFAMLLVPRALQGVGSALINVSGMSMMANMFREEETRLATIGFCLGGMAAGVLVGYPFGGLVYHWFGKQVLFYILIFWIILLLSSQLITFNWSPTNAPTHYDSKTIYIITNPNVILAIVIICVSTMTMSLLESFLPLWLIKEIRPPKWELGSYSALGLADCETLHLVDCPALLGVVFIPDSIGYLIGTNIFTLFYIALEHRWFLITTALCIIGVSALLVPVIPNLLYLIVPHFGIGFGIGAIDSALMPLLAELVDEQFAAQYGYVYAAAQTAASAAYAFGPLVGGALLNRRWLSFGSLMHLVGAANLALCALSYFIKTAFYKRTTVGKQSRSSITSRTMPEEEKVWIRMQHFEDKLKPQCQAELRQQGDNSSTKYSRFD